MTVLTTLTLQLPPERRDDVIRYYEEARILEHSGALSARLCVGSDGSGTVLVVAEWPDVAAYQAWQAAPERQDFTEGVVSAAGDEVTATSQVFQVVATTGSTTHAEGEEVRGGDD